MEDVGRHLGPETSSEDNEVKAKKPRKGNKKKVGRKRTRMDDGEEEESVALSEDIWIKSKRRKKGNKKKEGIRRTGSDEVGEEDQVNGS